MKFRNLLQARIILSVLFALLLIPNAFGASSVRLNVLPFDFYINSEGVSLTGVEIKASCLTHYLRFPKFSPPYYHFGEFENFSKMGKIELVNSSVNQITSKKLYRITLPGIQNEISVKNPFCRLSLNFKATDSSEKFAYYLDPLALEPIRRIYDSDIKKEATLVGKPGWHEFKWVDGFKPNKLISCQQHAFTSVNKFWTTFNESNSFFKNCGLYANIYKHLQDHLARVTIKKSPIDGSFLFISPNSFEAEYLKLAKDSLREFEFKWRSDRLGRKNDESNSSELSRESVQADIILQRFLKLDQVISDSDLSNYASVISMYVDLLKGGESLTIEHRTRLSALRNAFEPNMNTIIDLILKTDYQNQGICVAKGNCHENLYLKALERH